MFLDVNQFKLPLDKNKTNQRRIQLGNVFKNVLMNHIKQSLDNKRHTHNTKHQRIVNKTANALCSSR